VVSASIANRARVNGIREDARREGMKEFNYLDAIVQNKYARNADKLRAWLSASHIERGPQRRLHRDQRRQSNTRS